MKSPSDFMHQYVCFPCMLGRRRKHEGSYGSKPAEVLCSACHKPMRCLSYRIRIPVKDRKKWDAFEAWLDKDKARFEEVYIHEALTMLRKK